MATVLLVDDNENIRELVKLRLEIAGHDVTIAENGKIGLEKALQNTPDLVLLDMHMPVMSGHEAVQALRDSGYTGLVVALTASAMVSETNKARDSGCNGVIVKPISEDFEDEISTYLENFSRA